MLYTSYFAKSGNSDGAISVAIGTPRWFGKLPRYLDLAPTRAMLADVKEDPLGGRDRYEATFAEKLAALNPQKVLDDLNELAAGHDPIILCWEKPPVWCHRRIVAEWIEKELGIEVPEVGFARHRTPAVSAMPTDAPKRRPKQDNQLPLTF